MVSKGFSKENNRMIRYLSAAMTIAILGLAAGRAQDIVRVNHPHPHAPAVVEGGSCANGQCGTCATCNDCVRITEIKKTQHPVYDCKIKEICIPNCGLGGLFGHCSGGCTKIEVRQLVKKYRTDEECVSKCVTAEEAAKHYEAEAKKAAEKAKASTPAPAPAPAPGKLPTGSVGVDGAPSAPVATAAPQPMRLGEPIFIRNE
jgi:hypothetical protein